MALLVFSRQSKAGSRARDYSGERLKNLFFRPVDGGGSVIGRSGTVAAVDLGGPVRAVLDNDGIGYAVAAGQLHRIDPGPVVTVVGSGIPSTRATYMASSGTEIAVVAGGRYFVCDGAATVEYTTGAVDTPVGVAYQDGYFVVIGEGAGRKDMLTVSGLDDATTFDAAEFAFAESATDGLAGVVSDHGNLWLMGQKTVEVWQNTGNVDFPFAPFRGAQMQKGCADGKTVAQEDNAVFWVGPDNLVYRGSGGSPQVISTREVEQTLADNVIEGAFTFTDKGHKCYAIRLANAPAWVFDMTTQLWHERSTGVGETPWFATCSTVIGGVEHLGTSTGKIVTLDPDVFEDDGAVIEAEAVSVPVFGNGDAFAIGRAYAQIKGGVGGIGRVPQVMMQTTRNGHEWSQERWRPLGDTGNYESEARWHGLGSFRKRFQVRLKITDPVPRDIIGVHYG